MLKQQSYSFTIKCECSAFKNGLLITTKKKSKLSNLTFDPQNKTLTIQSLNSKQDNIVFELRKLKHIHRKFISEGKITLQFNEDMQKMSNEKIGVGLDDNKVERLSQIFVEAASPENLQLLIKKIVDAKKSMTTEVKSLQKKQLHIEKQHVTSDEGKSSFGKVTSVNSKQNYSVPLRFTESQLQKKKDPLKYNQKLRQYEDEQRNNAKLSRKQLMRQALLPNHSTSNIERNIVEKVIFKPEVDILELPSILLRKILEYTKMQLRHRLVSKKFSKFVLSNIQSLTFKDEVDDESFNKLAKYAINIRGRLKNVRRLQLIDVHDNPELQKDHAKSLYFGQWKQMSKKNIKQIKGLRVHTLQMPYQIKFQFAEIYGIRLRQLHLCSRTQVTTQNSFIADENLVYLFKHVRELEAFSIPYMNSSVLDELATNLKEKAAKLKVLRIGSLNENSKKEESWYLFHIYEQLRILKVQRVLKGGIMRQNVHYNLTFPLYVEQLSIGSLISEQTIHRFPTTLTKLTLIGEQYFNNDISNIYLPYLRVLDVSECPMVRPCVIELLEKCTKLRMVTNWEKQDIEYYKQISKDKDIEVVSVRDMTKR